MELGLSVELRYLVYCGVLMLVIWLPYIVAELASTGFVNTLKYPDERTLPDWARRLKAAHYNLVENIAPFAIAVIAAEFLDFHTALTQTCAMVFFWARVVHPVAQILRIWGTRTLIFSIGLGATLIYLLAILFSVAA